MTIREHGHVKNLDKLGFAILRVELHIPELPRIDQIGKSAGAIELCLSRYLKWNVKPPIELRLYRVTISSLLVDLAALQGGVEALSRVREALGGFIMGIAQTLEYACWHGLPPFLRKDAPTLDASNRGLIPVIGALMQAAEGGTSMDLIVDTGDQKISVSIKPNRQNRLHDGQEAIFKSERAKDWMCSIPTYKQDQPPPKDHEGPAVLVDENGVLLEVATPKPDRFDWRPNAERPHEERRWRSIEDVEVVPENAHLWSLWEQLSDTSAEAELRRPSFWVVVDPAKKPVGFISQERLRRLYGGWDPAPALKVRGAKADDQTKEKRGLFVRRYLENRARDSGADEQS